jgi:hypothetical protein
MLKMSLVLILASLPGCGSSSQPSSPLAIATASTLAQGVINVPYNTALSATGGITPYAWSVASGNLAPGISLSRAGVLSGTPTASGTFSFTVAVTDSEHPPSVANRSFSLTIIPAPQITTTSLPNGSIGVFYNATLAATGGIPPYSWTIVQGNLPSEITLNATSGVVSGAPTSAGTSSFTVQVSDSETPAVTATAALSILITPPPARNAALYTSDNQGNPATDRAGLQIQSNGSLVPLPSSPETAVNGSYFAPSPTLPLLFMLAGASIESFLVNPDYSLTLYSSAPLFSGANDHYLSPAVDPTGSNLYLPGTIDVSGTTGVTIFPGDGSLQPLGTVAIPNIATGSVRMVFTPDGSLTFIPTCSASNQGSILSYTRASDGTLTPAATYVLPPNICAGVLTVSPNGRYLADSEVQIYNIASDGTLTPVLSQPFTVTFGGSPIQVFDLAWDSSGSYLFVATGAPLLEGGLGVLSFSGSTLTETVPQTGGPVGRIQQTGSFVYALGVCINLCEGGPYGVLGLDFQNGQLTPLPGSPYQYGNGGDMVIY